MRPVRASSTSGVISARSTPMPERRLGGVKYSDRSSKTNADKNRSAVNRSLCTLYPEPAELNGLHPPAIYRNRNSSDVAGAFGGQEHHEIRKFFGRADAAEGNLHLRMHAQFQQPFGSSVAGADIVDQHVVWRICVRQ